MTLGLVKGWQFPGVFIPDIGQGYSREYFPINVVVVSRCNFEKLPRKLTAIGVEAYVGYVALHDRHL